MNDRFNEELFLTSPTGRALYHKYAENLPIIDYHCHLQPQEILDDEEFEDLGEMWLRGDHYKWRAMRTFGIDEPLSEANAEEIPAKKGVSPDRETSFPASIPLQTLSFSPS